MAVRVQKNPNNTHGNKHAHMHPHERETRMKPSNYTSTH